MKTPRKVIIDLGDDQCSLKTSRPAKVGLRLRFKNRPPLKVTNIVKVQTQEIWETAPV